MALTLLKAVPAKLRDLGLDERWLQDRIAEDPSILGLGDVQVLRKERRQPTKGRIDFLLHDPDSGVRYTVEVMLGSVDPSHIIRAIEYWDVERLRFPDSEYRAVIVAEEITSRFFNVLRLLNRSVPMIAVQLSAFRFDDSVVLHAVKVLDIFQADPDELEAEEGGESSRDTWQSVASSASLGAMDAVVALLPREPVPRVKYNRYHIAVSSSGRNFLWFHPRKREPHCPLGIRVAEDAQNEILEQLNQTGAVVETDGSEHLKLKVTAQLVNAHKGTFTQVLAAVEEQSRASDAD